MSNTVAPVFWEPVERFDLPVYYFREGTNSRAYAAFGAHLIRETGFTGWQFLLWAPHAIACSVVGSFNDWDPTALPMHRLRDDFWIAFSNRASEKDLYKFAVTVEDGSTFYRVDPFAFDVEKDGGRASRLASLDGFPWTDDAWLTYRRQCDYRVLPINVYEMHPFSWRRSADGKPLSPDRLARELIPYVKSMGYTHIELLSFLDNMPACRYAPPWSPHEMMAFVNACHEAGVGVFVDLGGFSCPAGENGLARFDGSQLFEQSDHSLAFETKEVRSWLLSSMIFWMEEYHVDGIRIDSVGQALSSENVDSDLSDSPSYSFFRQMNLVIKRDFPDALTFAEADVARRGVTVDAEHGGLGFDFRWNRAFTRDILAYLSCEPSLRREAHERLTMPMSSTFSEKQLLPLSSAFVHKEGTSLIGRMPGRYEDQFASLRLLFAAMIAFPGKKLSFMGNELAQFSSWSPAAALDFFLLDYPAHAAFHTFIRDLNFFYLEHEALYRNDYDWEGFQWISPDDESTSVIAFRRIAGTQEEILAVFNFSDQKYDNYAVGVPNSDSFFKVFSTDGSHTVKSSLKASPIPMHALPYSVTMSLPPLTALFWKVSRNSDELSATEDFPQNMKKQRCVYDDSSE